MKYILCYGDSNTYGYDPRDGGRYGEDIRWTDLLARDGNVVINKGLNGREIPTSASAYNYLDDLISRQEKLDILVLALGVNDAFNMPETSAKSVTNRWREVFCNVPAFATLKSKKIPVILVSPPFKSADYWGGDRAAAIMETLKGLSGEYRKLAKEEGLVFADAQSWGIELAYDGVHFGIEGSIGFYKKMKELIDDL